MLDGVPLLATTSIRNFQGATTDYMADAVKQALLLPEDMAELRSMRRHKIFLSLKRYLAMAIQAFFQAEEITNYYRRQKKVEEEGRRNTTVEAFNVAEKSNQELKKKLLEEERERKSATAALDNAEKQAESQRMLLQC